MTRALITGSTGRLGGVFLSQWENDARFAVDTLTRADADFRDPDQLEKALKKRDYDVLINPAAMSGLEECLDHPDEAQAINVLAPQVMAEVCREKGARFVHFSTDYVFAGHTPGKKSETNTPAPVNIYGKTKLAGEQAVMTANADAIIARVSWLFGPCPPGRSCHFDQVLTRAMSGEPQEYIHDKFSMPSFTPDVVQWTTGLLENESASGIYHLCNSGDPESWHSSAEKVCEIALELGIIDTLTSLAALPISDAHFFREPRPIHTAMQTNRLENEGIAQPRHWLETVAEYVKIR